MKRYDIVVRPTPAGAYWEAEPYLGGDWVKYEDAQAAIQEAVLAEREACAKLAELSHPDDWAFIGAALRNRSQK